MSKKLQFMFKVIASAKGNKTNVVAITNIMMEDGKSYLFAQEDQPISEHAELMKTEHYKRVKQSLVNRRDERSIWISCTAELEKVYFNEDGNIMFKGH
ncbi:hypothetical protein TKK_0000309 [Trichogramma kaykai]|uniref:Uncharacterized protein n=1 Tax=Trichogramma kaykai TaxID=54128 RepID=A0ABD2W7E9_9HYME